MRIAAFLSHPIQHFSPLWSEIAGRGGTDLRVYYYSRRGVTPTMDPGFGEVLAWDVEMLRGYEHVFLPRRWPTRDPLDSSWKGRNTGLAEAIQAVDVAYVSGYFHLNNWSVARYCRRSGVPLLYHSDSNVLAEERKPAWIRLLKRPVLAKFFRNVTVFLACGNHNRSYLELYGAPSARIRFCPIPVDTRRFQEAASLDDTEHKRREFRRRYRLGADDFVAGFSGKLIARKRPRDLLEAVKAAMRPGLRAFFIGSGPLEEELRKEGGPAVFSGFVNQSEMPRVLSLCDVLVMPSSHDPHPLIVTEAQCLGKPVILSDACGCYGPDDVFREGETGLLYPCGNVAQLSKAICHLIDHPEDCQRMGRRAVLLAEEQSVKPTADRFLEAARLAMDRNELSKPFPPGRTHSHD